MKKMLVFIVAVLMTGVFTVQAAEAKTGDDMAARLKLASKLLETMDVGKVMTQSFESIKQMQSSMTKQMVKNAKDQQLAIKNQHKIMDLMQKELSWEKLRPEFEKLYAETYSLEELNGLIKFYESPVGKKFIQKQPEMQRKSMLMMQQLIMKIMPKIQALTKQMQQEMIAAKKAEAKK